LRGLFAGTCASLSVISSASRGFKSGYLNSYELRHVRGEQPK
jgi:hypothetical protein